MAIEVAALCFTFGEWTLYAADASSQKAKKDDPILHVDTMDKGYLFFPVRILARSTYEALTFDPTQGKPATISYKLTRDGDIRIRVVWRHQKELVLRTLLDWTHQDFGPQTIQWDGRDAGGNLVDNTKCLIDFAGDSPKHKKHEPGKCHELRLKRVSPSTQSNTIVRLSEIRLEIGEDCAYGDESGYQVRTYVDYEQVGQATPLPGGTRSFALADIESLAGGWHLITVNVDDRHDHVGVAGLRVLVSEAGFEVPKDISKKAVEGQ